MADKGEERRRGERLNINEEFEAVGANYVSDLSEHGVFVHTPDLLAMGTTVELRFTVLLDDPVVIQGLGKVVRHQKDPPGMGVEFGPLSPAMVLRIQDVLSRQRPRDSGPPIGDGQFDSQELKTREFGTRKISEDEFDQAKTGTFEPINESITELDDGDIEALDDSRTRSHPAVDALIDDDEAT